MEKHVCLRPLPSILRGGILQAKYLGSPSASILKIEISRLTAILDLHNGSSPVAWRLTVLPGI